MKCVSCQVEINPQWKHAIDKNVCPFCGDVIMEEKLKDLFSTLTTTMEALKEYPEQLDDWMFSNYEYVKTTSKELQKFLPKQSKASLKEKQDESVGEEYIVNVQTEEGEVPVVAKKIQSEERTNTFFKRAEAVKPGIDGFTSTAEKTKHIKGLVKQIREGGSQSIDGSGGASILSAEMMEHADPSEVAELEALISGGGGDFMNSALPSASSDDDDIPAAVLAMSVGARSTSDKDAKDLASLQKLVNKSRGSGGGGSFSRSGS